MNEEYGLKFVVNGEGYDKIKKSLNEQIEDLQQKVEQLENIRKEAIEYIKNNSYFESNIVKTMLLGDYSSGLLNILNKGE